MKLKSKQLSALAKYVVTLTKMQLPELKLSVQWLSDTSQDLGYTNRNKNKAAISLNNGSHPIIKELNNSQSVMMLTGIAIHEIMHQLLTNFVLTNKMRESLPREKQQLFMTMANIFEDSRIESFAPSYFAGDALKALEFTIQTIWDKAPEINGEEEPVFNQVLNALIQFGDIGLVKPEMSEEAEEVYEKILPLFNAAIDSTSCTNCLLKAKLATDILLPYMPEEYKDETAKGSSDSEGEDADDAGRGSSKHSRRVSKRRLKASKEASEKSSSKGKKEGDKDEGEGSDKDDKDEGKGSGKDETPDKGDDSKEEEDDGIGGDGDEGEDGEDDSLSSVDSECDLTKESSHSGSEDWGEIEEFTDTDEATEEELREAAEAADSLLEELERMAEDEEAESAASSSDYDLPPMDSVPASDKFVKNISHHKASQNSEAYEKIKETIAVDAHTLAKIITRHFKTKSGGKKRADNGDLNILRYKDPNFNSPRIFDKKKPRERHSAAVLVLVDESGSMGGSRITNARIATAMLAEAMAEAGIPCAIIGHSGDRKYNTSVEFEHYTTFKNAKTDRESIPMISARNQNRDGPAIRWASDYLKKRHERKKLMIVISDGQPCADYYYGDEAIFDTKSAIRDAKRNHDVIGIAIQAPDANILHTMYGEDFVQCNNPHNLKDSIAKIVLQKCKTW